MKRFVLLFAVVCLLVPSFSIGKMVEESARQIPLAYDVDIVVVGGSSAGVAAAVEAAENGASVFLAAPRTFLGEDLCSTYRLWLEPGEEPSSELAKRLFAEPESEPAMGKPIPFEYEADKSSAQIHKDTPKPSLLTDGKWNSASSQSVQYDGDVNIIADLGRKRSFANLHVLVYQRNNDFEVKNVDVSVSDDKENWRHVADIENSQVGKGRYEDSCINLSADVNETARYVKFEVQKTSDVDRVLLGEIVITEGPPEPGDKKSPRLPPSPMQVKHELDSALLDAGVQFLFGCYATDVLHDEDGNLAGIVMENRSGRQAVKAKVIIDAMARAPIVRAAGAVFEPYPSGEQTFKRVVIGGEPRRGVECRQMPSAVRATPKNLNSAGSQDYPAFEYTLEIQMQDASFASFAEAEQVARDLTWHPQQIDSSEVLFQVPPDPMKGKKSLRGAWPGVQELDLDAFRPAGMEGIYVLGGCADMPRDSAAELLRPLNYLEAGKRIGTAAAKEAQRRPEPTGIRLEGTDVDPVATGDIRQLLVGVRPVDRDLPKVPAEPHGVPVIGEYDVVVVGGGTGGAPAGIGAARRGAKTLVVEYLYGLGGVGTLGLIGKYYHGHREGFTAELDAGIEAMGGERGRGGWNIEHKMEWYRREIRKAGGDIWYGTLGCGAFVEDGRVKGVVVGTPQGRGVILSEVLIDSTGSSDIAIAAGADYMFTGAEHAALQGTGLPPRQPDANYTNTDYTFTDETDLLDTWRTFLAARHKFQNAYDLGQIVDTRERRRIIGDFVISPLDIANGRTYPDSVVLSKSNFDSHGYTVHPFFLLKPPDRAGLAAYTPYRALLPRGLDGIIVTGLGISAHRDAMPILRMQPCIQNQGYGMGVAASMAAENNVSTRDIDIKTLQRHLVEKGSLPENVLTDNDTFPVPQERIAEAVVKAASDYHGIKLLLAQPEDALPLLRQAYKAVGTDETQGYDRPKPPSPLPEVNQEDAVSPEQAKLVYAHILGMMGDPTGSDTLIEAVKTAKWDDGWSFKGMGQFGMSISPLDSKIIALGRTEDPDALEPILELAGRLTSESELSHFRAVSMALETLGDPAGAKTLASLLNLPGVRGHAFTDIQKARRETPAGLDNNNVVRDRTLRELILARALYRCGDWQGLGEEILKEYQRDFRGHLARHAQAVLETGTVRR